MKLIVTLTSAALLAVAGFTAAVMADDVLPPVPPTPAPVMDLVSAQPFVLQQGFASDWRKERPVVSSGYLLVLKVNPDMVYPRQTLQPVLYVGNQTAERINSGHESGYVVAIVPAPLTEGGTMALDLAQTPIWFGTPAMPESVDTAKVNGEVALAKRAGIKPFTAAKVQTALQAGGAQVTLADKTALLAHLAPLISQYSPQEKAQADQYLGKLPVAPGTATGTK